MMVAVASGVDGGGCVETAAAAAASVSNVWILLVSMPGTTLSSAIGSTDV